MYTPLLSSAVSQTPVSEHVWLSRWKKQHKEVEPHFFINLHAALLRSAPDKNTSCQSFFTKLSSSLRRSKRLSTSLSNPYSYQLDESPDNIVVDSPTASITSPAKRRRLSATRTAPVAAPGSQLDDGDVEEVSLNPNSDAVSSRSSSASASTSSREQTSKVITHRKNYTCDQAIVRITVPFFHI